MHARSQLSSERDRRQLGGLRLRLAGRPGRAQDQEPTTIIVPVIQTGCHSQL